MTRWPFIIAAIAFLVFVFTACAPPPPKPGPAAWYDAANDTIYYDQAWMAQTAAWYGQAGVDWITAHEEGHRTVFHLWQTEHIALWTWMPGPTEAIQQEQAAQCEATAKLGPEPWVRPSEQVAAGYWRCPDAYVALVKAAG